MCVCHSVYVRSQGPKGTSFAKLLCNLGDSVVGNGSGADIQLPENQGVGECVGVGEALVVDHRTEDSEGSGSLIHPNRYRPDRSTDGRATLHLAASAWRF